MMSKEKQYEWFARTTNFLGHWYIGFEGKRCSRMATDDLKSAKKECAWVWDCRRNRWAKRPEVTSENI